MAVTRIKNNQITDSSVGNVYLGINAGTKVQDYSITAGKIANSLTYGSDLTITGNLTVQGQTTTIDTVSTVIEDPVIVLAANQTGSPTVDIGFIGERGTSDNIAFVWDESTGEFVTAFTADLITNTTITISSYANFHTNDANIGGNITINGTTSLVGNITSAVNVTGNITGGNLLTPGVVTATGNITGGNVSAGSGIISTTGNVNGANVNASSGVTAGTTVIATGNITGGNVDTAGQVVATGNVLGGNITTTGNIDGANVNASSGITAGTTVIATGNIAGGNLTTIGNVVAIGNVSGEYIIANSAIIGNVEIEDLNVGNITASGFANITGNITGGNITTAGLTNTGTLETTGNALIGGNLIVQGNITYINIDDLRVEDPVIILGTGPNGAPLTVNDGLDRGIYMEYYVTGVGTANAFSGFDNSSGNMIIANNVEFAGNDIVQVNSYGTLEAGNLYVQSAVSTGNITGGNITTAGITSTGSLTASTTIDATGNITGGNVSAGSGIISTTGNVNGDNVNASAGITAGTTIDATGNITGGNITTAGITSTGSLTASTTINATGNITGGNIDTAGQVTATGNITGGNLITSGTGGSIVGTGNITGGNINTAGQLQGGNIVISGDDITDTNGRVNINTAGADVDFAVNGDTVANVFYVDAGTGTASFGTSTQTTGAIVAFNDPTSILMPVGNTAQRPGTGVLGMFRFNSIDDNLEVYSTAGWEAVGVPVFTVIADEQFNGDGSTVVFALGSEQTTASCIVSINGVIQVPTVAYSVSGLGTSTLTFTEAPQPGDLIDVRQLTTSSSVTSISNTGSNAVIAADGTSGTINITGNIVPVSNVAYNLGSPTNFWNDLYLSGNTIYLGNLQMQNNNGNLRIRNFDDSADAVVEATFVATSTTSGNLQIGLNHIEATNPNGEITLAPNGTGNTQLQSNIVRIGKQNTNVQLTSWGTGNIDLAVNSSNIARVSSSGLTVTGSIEATGGFIGLDATAITNGTSSVAVISSGGNVRTNIAGATVQTISAGGANITGTLGVSGNITGGNITPGGNIQVGAAQSVRVGNLIITDETISSTDHQITIGSNSAIGNVIIVGNLQVNGTTTTINSNTVTTNDLIISVANNAVNSAAANGGGYEVGPESAPYISWLYNQVANTWVSSAGINAVGSVTVNSANNATAIVNGGGNGVGNIGASGATFNTIFAKATSAQYADLAEKYTADAEYAPGTVVSFGGDSEVTVTSTDADRAVAGVVSTNPSYIMNSECAGEFVATVALTGRVPCRVVGSVKKGDLMVSAGNGVARAEADPRVGTVIGKALADSEGDATIEVVVGRF